MEILKKLVLFIAITSSSFLPATPVSAGSGSEACVTYCSDAAAASYEYGTKEYSAYFRGCMMTCFLD